MECEISHLAKCNPNKCKGTYKCKAFIEAARMECAVQYGIARKNHDKALYDLAKEFTAAKRNKDSAAVAQARSKLQAENELYDKLIKLSNTKFEALELQYKCLPSSIHRGMDVNGVFKLMDSWSEVRMYHALEDTKLSVEYGVRIPVPGFKGPYIADFKVEYKGSTIYLEVKADYYMRDDQMAKIKYLREHGYSIIMIDSNFIDKQFPLPEDLCVIKE